MPSIEEFDQMPFRRYTTKSEIDKAVNTLEGLIHGIAIDGIINSDEIAELENWFHIHKRLLERHPFSELAGYLNQAFADRYLSEEERADILWFCKNLKSNGLYYDYLTADMQKLHGILHGVLADGHINKIELEQLHNWLLDHEYMSGIYPYDELCSVLTAVLQDGYISEEEHRFLKVFFSEFIDLRTSLNLNAREIEKIRETITIPGICAVCPTIIFQGRIFCFTGLSSRAKRHEVKGIIESVGGIYHDNVIKETNYLIVGDNGNPCWAFSCYGRKVEKAMNMRKVGHPILIVHENDFWDEIQNVL